jgi:hypothetical protein
VHRFAANLKSGLNPMHPPDQVLEPIGVESARVHRLKPPKGGEEPKISLRSCTHTEVTAGVIKSYQPWQTGENLCAWNPSFLKARAAQRRLKARIVHPGRPLALSFFLARRRVFDELHPVDCCPAMQRWDDRYQELLVSGGQYEYPLAYGLGVCRLARARSLARSSVSHL